MGDCIHYWLVTVDLAVVVPPESPGAITFLQRVAGPHIAHADSVLPQNRHDGLGDQIASSFF